MAIDFPNSPSPGTNHTVDGKTWTFTDGKWALNVSVGGVQGPAGVAIQGTAPATTDVLWADTSDTGLVIVPAGGTTGQVLAKSSSASYDTAWATPVTSGDMALKADLASPTFTGTPTLPTGTIATTQTAGNSSTAVATTAFVGTAVANLVDSAPATLNTLDELALALGDDANFATTTATAIGLKAPLANPTFTGTVSGITKTMVGLGSVDNTADTAKPVSTAQQTALNLKADIASPALTGTPTSPTAADGTNSTQIATMASKPWNTAWGFITQGTLSAGTGYITAEQDLISITFTAVANRRYRYTATGLVVSDGVGPMSTNLTDTANNRIREYFTYFSSGAGSNYQTGIIDYVETFASSGSVTRKIRNQSTSMGVYYYGAGVRDSIAWKLRVEDIGPA